MGAKWVGFLMLCAVCAGRADTLIDEDFGSGSLGTNLERDSEGFHRGGSSAWVIDSGVLKNTSLVNSTVSEGAVASVIDLTTLDIVGIDQFTLSFDYTLAENDETLYVHVWGYVDHSSTPTTTMMNLGASNGNAWETASPAYMTGYNFGNSNGAFIGTEGIASDAAVSLSGVLGETSYIQTFDLSEFTTAPNMLGAYDYLVIGFARSISGTAPSATLDNVEVTVPNQSSVVVYTREAGDSNWSNLSQWNDDRTGSVQDSFFFPSTNDTVVLSASQVLTVDTNVTVSSLSISGSLIQSSETVNATLRVENGGVVNLNGGTFNSPIAADVSVDGELIVDGGILSQDLNGAADVVQLTGSGAVVLESGTITFPGGINTSVLNIKTDVEIRGGTFNSTAQNRLTSEFRVVGDNATIQCSRLTSQSGSSFVFELGPSGASPIVSTSYLNLGDALVEVDAGSYVHSGGTDTMLLFNPASLLSLVDSAHVSFSGFIEQRLVPSITQNQTTDEVNLVVEPYIASPTVTFSESLDWSSMSVSESDVVLVEPGAVVTIDSSAVADELVLDGVLRFKIGMLGVEPLTLSSFLTVGDAGAIVIDGTDYEALDGHMPLIRCSQIFSSLTQSVSFVGFEGREPSVVVTDEGLWLRLIEPPAFSERLSSLAPQSTASTDYTDSVFSATRAYQSTGTAWAPSDQSIVMNTTLEQEVTTGGSETDNRSWAMTLGHGGQIASFRIPSLGETVPPQTGADWIDEVWQSVAIDTALNNSTNSSPYFIHQAGVYSGKDVALEKAFYSPSVAAYLNEEERSFMMINWGQQAHIQIYTNSDTVDDWRSDLLYFTNVKDLGQGVIEVSQGYYNYGVDMPNYFNMPWGGVRRTSTEYAFFSDTDESGWSGPVEGTFGDGTKANYSATGGTIAFSASTNGTTPCLGLVFGQDPEPRLPYQTAASLLRHGYHGTFDWDETSWRNYYVISAIRKYNLSQGRGVWSRYYFVLGDDLDDLGSRIAARNLTAVPSFEAFDYTEESTPLVAYSYTGSGASFRIVENSTSPQFFLYAYPVSGSFPIYEILEEDETYHITWDPYATGVIKTYDGTISGIRLLGFSRRTADVSGSTYTYESLDTLMASASENYHASGETLSVRTASPFETWRVQHFGMTDDSGDGAGTANPDGDTANNLEEYAMGGDPLDITDTGYLPMSGILRENGTNWFEYVHPRRIGSEGELEYMVETSSNLISNDWKTGSAIKLPMTGILDAEYEAVTNRIDTAGKTNEFIRLRIEQK